MPRDTADSSLAVPAGPELRLRSGVLVPPRFHLLCGSPRAPRFAPARSAARVANRFIEPRMRRQTEADGVLRHRNIQQERSVAVVLKSTHARSPPPRARPLAASRWRNGSHEPPPRARNADPPPAAKGSRQIAEGDDQIGRLPPSPRPGIGSDHEDPGASPTAGWGRSGPNRFAAFSSEAAFPPSSSAQRACQRG